MPIRGVEHIITRGDWRSSFAYDLSLVEPDKIRFTIADETGKRSIVEGVVAPSDAVTEWYYAQFDPETGQQWLLHFGDCKILATTKTAVRPAVRIDNPAVRLVEGYRGRILGVKVGRGLQIISPPSDGTRCGLHSEKLP